MKKVSFLMGTLALCGVLFLVGCAQVGDTVVSCAEVKASDLPASGARNSVSNSVEAAAVIGAIATDTTSLEAMSTIVSRSQSFVPNSRSVTLDELSSEIMQAISQVSTQLETIDQTGNGTVSFNLKKKGNVKGLADGLSANIRKAKAEINVSNAESENFSVVADAAVDLSAEINIESLLKANNISGQTVLRGVAANVAANAGFSLNKTMFDGKAGVAFSCGVSAVSPLTQTGGKFIVTGFASAKGTLSEKDVAVLEKMFSGESVSQDEINSLPISFSLNASFYDDNDNVTYTMLNAETLFDAYSGVLSVVVDLL